MTSTEPIGTVEDYADALAALLPPGPYWEGFSTPGTRARALLLDMAGPLADVDARATALRVDLNPTSSTETLPDRETEAALPDPCVGALAETVQERRAAVVAKWAARGGQTIAYFQGLAAALGYEVTVTEWRPFVAGISRCGDRLNGGQEVRFVWTVRVPGPRVTRFRTGLSAPPERLMTLSRAVDLECKLRHLKPAQSTLIFRYSGA
jgi:uncharacterized protein YmfQ (DUF2313 family)